MKTVYKFGRLHMIGFFTEIEQKKDFVIKCLYNPFKISSVKGNMWNIINVNKVYKYFVGYMVKYSDSSQEEIVDETENTLQTTNINKKVNEKYPFVMNIEDFVIAYTENQNSDFKNTFCDILNNTSTKFSIANFEISEISDNKKFFDEIGRAEFVNKIKIELQPSNPKFKELWKEVDEDLRKAGIQKLKEQYEGENIKVEEHSNLSKKLYMASDGYGIGEAICLIDGDEVKISTNNNQLTKDVNFNKDEVMNAVNELDIVFENIKNRYNDSLNNWR